MTFSDAISRVYTTCPMCGSESYVDVNLERYMRWKRKEAPIQDLLPELTVSQREQLMTGYDQKCWDRMFPPESQ